MCCWWIFVINSLSVISIFKGDKFLHTYAVINYLWDRHYNAKFWKWKIFLWLKFQVESTDTLSECEPVKIIENPAEFSVISVNLAELLLKFSNLLLVQIKITEKWAEFLEISVNLAEFLLKFNHFSLVLIKRAYLVLSSNKVHSDVLQLSQAWMIFGYSHLNLLVSHYEVASMYFSKAAVIQFFSETENHSTKQHIHLILVNEVTSSQTNFCAKILPQLCQNKLKVYLSVHDLNNQIILI